VYLVYDWGNHQTVRYRWRNCRNEVIPVKTNIMPSNTKLPSWGTPGTGMCFGDMTLEVALSACLGVLKNKKKRIDYS
jgi:hypothetical protein